MDMEGALECWAGMKLDETVDQPINDKMSPPSELTVSYTGQSLRSLDRLAVGPTIIVSCVPAQV
jgi:hypothetical protein